MSAITAASAAYIVAGLLFILSLAGLSRHETAKAGNAYGIAGMAIALAATIGLATRSISALGLTLLVVAMIVGATIGLWRARRGEEGGLPQPIAIPPSFVGPAPGVVGRDSIPSVRAHHPATAGAR